MSDRFFLFCLELLHVHQITASDNKPPLISCMNWLFSWHQKSRIRPTFYFVFI
nr:MAG TPA: hypothetical protein [Bacteriophage sp.]